MTVNKLGINIRKGSIYKSINGENIQIDELSGNEATYRRVVEYPEIPTFVKVINIDDIVEYIK